MFDHTQNFLLFFQTRGFSQGREEQQEPSDFNDPLSNLPSPANPGCKSETPKQNTAVCAGTLTERNKIPSAGIGASKEIMEGKKIPKDSTETTKYAG